MQPYRYLISASLMKMTVMRRRKEGFASSMLKMMMRTRFKCLLDVDDIDTRKTADEGQVLYI